MTRQLDLEAELDGVSEIDALLPPAMARRAEEAGVRKAEQAPVGLLVLAVLAGAFIALGDVFAIRVPPRSSVRVKQLCLGLRGVRGLLWPPFTRGHDALLGGTPLRSAYELSTFM